MRPIYKIGEAKSTRQPPKNQKRHEENEEETNGARWYLKSVRNLINVFEQKDRERNKPFRQNLNKLKSKSYASLRPIAATSSRTKDVVSRFETHKQKTGGAFSEIDTVKNAAISLKTKITESKNIDSKECIVYQNQIIALLTKIGSLESNGNPLVKEEKQRCLKIVQSCNTVLKNKSGEEEAPPMALGSFVRTLTKYEDNKEPVSKVQRLRGIFEAKKDDVVPKKPQQDSKKQPKPPLVIEDEFSYTPYSEYLKRKNSEERSLPSMPKMQDTSKSCENIASHDYSGIKRLLNRLNDKKKETTHYRAKSLTDIKVDTSSVKSSTAASSAEDVVATIEEPVEVEEPEVKLVSVKPAEDAEIPVAVVREKAETPILNGGGDETLSESDDNEDSEGDDHKHSSGFYSFVGDESLDDTFHDAEQEKEDDGGDCEVFEKSFYEPFTNVTCKMSNGLVNITLNGVQVE